MTEKKEKEKCRESRRKGEKKTTKTRERRGQM